MKTYTQEDLKRESEGLRTTATVRCRFVRPFAGGMPAGDKGIRALVEHHLGIPPEDPEFEKAVERIKKEEIGSRDETPEEGELKEDRVYQLNVIRRSDLGPWFSEHQVKAVLKQAASRLGVFTKSRGSKGDLAEMGTVEATGGSLQNVERPWEIYLRNGSDEAKTSFTKVHGSVNTPKGRKSIVHHTEIAPEDTTFAFAIHWPSGRLSKEAMRQVVWAATQIGLGSCLSLGYGRFEVVEMEV